MARIVSVSRSQQHTFSKPVCEAIHLVAGHGVEGDAHAGVFIKHRYLARWRPRLPNVRQVHLLESELRDRWEEAGFRVGPGEFGENIGTCGIDLHRLPLGTELRLGTTAVVELSGLRKPCVLIDRFQPGLRALTTVKGEMPEVRAGVMAVVRRSGWVRPSDEVVVLMSPEPHRLLPAI